MIDVATLASLGLFKNARPGFVAELARHLRPLSIDAGEAVITEGQTTAAPLLFVTQGELVVTRRGSDGKDHVIVSLRGPTVIGELEFLTELPCSATVRAESDVAGAALGRDRFNELLATQDPTAFHLALAIGRLVSERLSATNDLLTKVLARQPEEVRAVVRGAQSGATQLDAVDAELDALLGR